MDRVNQLLVWAEGSTGRGTDEIWDALAQLQQGSLASQGQAFPSFQPYLQAILENEDYREWQECYAPTTVEGRKPLPQPERPRRLKLRVETVVAKDESANGASDKPSEGEPQEKIEQFEVLEGLRQYAADHVLLVGKPGSGKSSSLEWLLWNEACCALDDPTAKIPVLVKLRRCTSTLEALIQDFFSGHGLPLSLPEVEALLSQGKLLLLLDGLNELPANLGTEMANFRSRYRKTTPMVVSTREQSIGGTLGITKTLKMLPLSEPQMQEFVQGYLGDEGKALFQQIKGDHLRKFAETPLLLWMLCRVFAQNGHIPSNLGMAFREFTQLYDRQIQEDAPTKSRDQWPKLLRHLAFALMHDKELVDFRLSMPREEAENVLTTYLQQEGRTNARENAERWLQDLLDYHLIQPVVTENLEKHIEFRHQLIQEYYAAEYLLDLLPDVLKDEGKFKRDYLNLLKWTEPIALMLAILDKEDEALEVVSLALFVDWLLGARLSGEINSNFQPTAINWIVRLIIPENLKIELLAKFNSDLTVTELSHYLDHPSSEVRESAAIALRQNQYRTSLSLLIKFLDSESLNARKIFALLLGDRGDYSAVPTLFKMLESGSPDDHWSAGLALNKIGRKNDDQNLLKKLEDEGFPIQIFDDIPFGKDEIYQELKNNKKDNHDLFSSNFIEGNKHESIRNFLPEPLLNLSEDAEPRLLGLLRDENIYVRLYATQLLNAESDSGISQELLAQLRHEDWDIRLIAVSGLGRIGCRAALPEVLPLLEDIDRDVRKAAAKALARIGCPTPLPLLWQLCLEGDVDLLKTIIDIQKICKFYNYEIWQEAMIAQNTTKESLEAKTVPASNIFPSATEVKIFERVEHYYERPSYSPDQ